VLGIIQRQQAGKASAIRTTGDPALGDVARKKKSAYLKIK
jgi:hypothetical protein